LKLLAVSIGAIIYYVVIQAVASLSDMDSNYLKLISALIVALFLSVPYWKGKYIHGTKGFGKAKAGK
jgi:putative ABC transport system permease protein